jgi:predicted MFS family arabinose efflux permease
MPLGPDLATNLNIAEHKLGWIAGSYTFAAAVTGILGSTFIDKFERRKVLIFTVFGLVIANLFSANAWNIESLLTSRLIAGAFGGPATSICFAIIADLFEENRRGSIMGKVMSGFSLAAIFGVPIGLAMATKFGWYASFYLVASLGIITIILIKIFMPKITIHLDSVKTHKVTYLNLFNKPKYLLTFIAACLGSMASFMIIPYISPFVQMNMNYPRADVWIIYSVGGIGSFFAMNIAGKFVDKTTSALTTMLANIFILFTLILCFIFMVPSIHVVILCAPFMIGMAIRNVSNYTLFSKIPSLNDRAGFMSIISCVQHLASSLGAIATSLIVIENNEKLQYMDIATMVAIVLFLIVPFILMKVEKTHYRAKQA